MADFNIFKVQYDWYDGEHQEILVGKAVEVQQFEKDLAKAKHFAESLRGKEVMNRREIVSPRTKVRGLKRDDFLTPPIVT